MERAEEVQTCPAAPDMCELAERDRVVTDVRVSRNVQERDLSTLRDPAIEDIFQLFLDVGVRHRLRPIQSDAGSGERRAEAVRAERQRASPTAIV